MLNIFQRRAMIITVAVVFFFFGILARNCPLTIVFIPLFVFIYLFFSHLQISAAPVLQTYELKPAPQTPAIPMLPFNSAPFDHLFVLLSTSFALSVCLFEFPGKDVLIISCKNMIPVYSTEKNPIAQPSIGLGFSVE